MKVLFATDGSDFSRQAIEKGCEIFGGDTENVFIKAISVVDVPYAPPEPFAVSADYYRDLEAEQRKQAEKFTIEAETQIRSCLADSGAKAEVTTQIRVGKPAQEIVEEAESWSADLIVTGSHGYGFWKRAWLGSVSDSIVQHAPCSVLIVRKKHSALS